MKRRVKLIKERRSRRGAIALEYIVVMTAFVVALMAFREDIQGAFENMFGTAVSELDTASGELGGIIEVGTY